MKTYNDLKQVDVTEGTNGYPKNLYLAYTSDSIKELQEVQDNEGGDFVVLKKREGHSLYTNLGLTYYNSFLDAPQPGQDFYLIANRDSAKSEAMSFVLGDCPNISAYLIECYEDIDDLNQLSAIYDSIQYKIDDIILEVGISEQDVLINFGSTNENICYSVSRDDASFKDDVYTYQYALIKD
jgi:hypothetical protein